MLPTNGRLILCDVCTHLFISFHIKRVKTAQTVLKHAYIAQAAGTVFFITATTGNASALSMSACLCASTAFRHYCWCQSLEVSFPIDKTITQKP